ncbi:MAG TPA: fructose-bisphosphatase class III, partial [Candidatus Onthocola gallistercoris]|nr:fructose-bisphosphatase class III [Candidatus Onthocola gallistercoris]
ANFAVNTYGDDPCEVFDIHYLGSRKIPKQEMDIEMRMHKAISVIQFKLEGQTIMRHPEFNMDSRLLLDKIDYDKGTVNIEGEEYPLNDTRFPTIDPEHPYDLSPKEQEVMTRLVHNFRHCEKLQKHIRFLFKSGSIYLTFNDNLYYHGCVPLNEDGSFREVTFKGKVYSGKALYDFIESYCRKGYYLTGKKNKEKIYGQDMMWFAWSNENSPVFGKEKMATFERYFVSAKEAQRERKDAYYSLIEREDVCDHILREFGLDPATAHIINGHMPVKPKAGETPIKCGGKLLIIDGGFSKAYQKTTGIAGYTLIYNSYGLRLVTHQSFQGLEKAIVEETDICDEINVVQKLNDRMFVADTDNGKILKERIKDLELLLMAYRTGVLREAVKK